MAKKRKAKAPDRKPRKWSREEKRTLLAWLDFSLKHKEVVDFDEGVADHLGGAFTREQIERQLKTLWNNHGPDGPDSPKDWHDIKIRGSLSLHNKHGLDEKQRNDIALAVEKLEKVFFLELSTPNRRLRSSSRVDTGSNQKSWLNTPPVEKNGKTQGRKRKLGSDSSTPPGAKHEIERVDIESSKTNPSRKKPKTYSKRDVRASSHRFVWC
jgi:hypothetical protein